MDTVAPELDTEQAHTNTGLSLVPLSTRAGRVLLAELRLDGRPFGKVRLNNYPNASRPEVFAVISPDRADAECFTTDGPSFFMEVPGG